MNPVAIGLGSIARKDSTELRRHMFEGVLAVNWLARLIFRLYGMPGMRRLVCFALVLRPIAHVLSARIEIGPADSLVLVHYYSNERRALARFRDAQSASCGSISYSVSLEGLLRGAAWLLSRAFHPRKALQAFRISFARARNKGFLVGARQAEFLLLYAYFHHRLKNLRGKTFVSSSESNPEIIAPVLAARALGNESTYVNHGFLVEDLGLFFHERLVVDCEAVLERIQANLAPGAAPRVEWDRALSRERELRLPDFDAIHNVGIVGSITMRADEFSAVVADCLEAFPRAVVSVRPHPNTACSGEFYRGLANQGRVRVVTAEEKPSLLELASSWDFAIGGSTSVHLELLRAGVPTVYMDFDGIDPDLYGFIDSVTVPKAERASEIRERLRETYSAPAWKSRFARFSGVSCAAATAGASPGSGRPHDPESSRCLQ